MVQVLVTLTATAGAMQVTVSAAETAVSRMLTADQKLDGQVVARGSLLGHLPSVSDSMRYRNNDEIVGAVARECVSVISVALPAKHTILEH